jgi:hypothetical protein
MLHNLGFVSALSQYDSRSETVNLSLSVARSEDDGVIQKAIFIKAFSFLSGSYSPYRALASSSVP